MRWWLIGGGTIPDTRLHVEALQASIELDLEALADIVPARGYGRD